MNCSDTLAGCCWLFLALLFAACNSSIRESSELPPDLRSDVVKAQLSPDGMAQLYTASNPTGLPIVAAPTAFLMGADTVQLGPLDAELPVSTRSFQPSEDLAATLTRLSAFRTFVPVRITSATETRICKFQIDTSDIDVVAAVGLEVKEGRQVLSVVDTPTIAAGTVTAQPFGPCDTNVDLTTLIAPIQNYVLTAIVASTGTSLEAPIVSALGLLDGSVELTPFPVLTTRGGEMIISQAPSSSGVRLASDGVSLSFDARISSERAACISPISISQGDMVTADDIDSSELVDRGADLALAVSIQTLTAIAQGATLSGLACFDVDAPLDVITRDEAALQDLGLVNLPIGPEVLPVIVPGSLPELTLDASGNRVRLRFQSLTVEAHSEMFGVVQRIISIDADVEFSLAIQPGSTGLRFDIESIDVTRAVPDTKWSDFVDEDVQDWVRRFLLLTLSSRFSYPLPISPEFPVRALEADVRTNDIVLYISIGE